MRQWVSAQLSARTKILLARTVLSPPPPPTNTDPGKDEILEGLLDLGGGGGEEVDF